MDADGGMSKYPTNGAGAKYGTGYCDAQCPHDMKFINGEANCEDWKPSETDANAGTGKYGTCCTEFDMWEGNSISTAYTAHSCSVEEQFRCEGVDCGDNGADRFKGVCDKNGCDIQTYRLGEEQFYGPGASFTIDSTKPVRVTTQFITDDGTDNGKLVDIKRTFSQGGKKVEIPSLNVGGKSFNSISPEFCQAEVDTFKDGTNFLEKGGFDATGLAFEKGMVLALSLWDDHYANMLWLDSTYPVDSTDPGAKRGTCATTSGDPKDVESNHPDASVRFFNIRYGDIGTTDPDSPSPGPTPSPSPSPTPSPVPSDCPGGSLDACIDLCPADVFAQCVKSCQRRCASAETVV